MPNLILLFDQYGVFFLFFLIALTDAGLPIPIPYDLMILLAGQQGFPLWQVIMAVVLGAVVGNSILFFLARNFGYRLLEKYEGFLFLSHRTHRRMEGWFLRFGPLVVIVARLVPGLRFTASFISGLLRLPYKRAFLPSMIFASFLWATSYYYFGKIIGEGISYFLSLSFRFSIFSLAPIMVILAIVVFVIFQVRVDRGKMANL